MNAFTYALKTNKQWKMKTLYVEINERNYNKYSFVKTNINDLSCDIFMQKETFNFRNYNIMM